MVDFMEEFVDQSVVTFYYEKSSMKVLVMKHLRFKQLKIFYMQKYVMENPFL